MDLSIIGIIQLLLAFVGFLVFLIILISLYHHFKPFIRDIPTSNKVIFITGGASGLGKETTERLLKEGCVVYSVDLSLQNLQNVYSHHKDNNKLKLMEANICDINQLKSVGEILKKDNVTLDAIVNCAGILRGKNKNMWRSIIEDDVDDDTKIVFNVNVYGAIRVNRVLYPFLRKGNSRIVNISSIASRFGGAGYATYSISKYGLRAVSEVMRWELEYHGVKVIDFEPAIINTPFGSDAGETASEIVQHSLNKNYELFSKIFPIRDPMTVEFVSNKLLDSLFCSNFPRNFIVERFKEKFVWGLIILMPYNWVDYLFGLF